MNENTVVTIVIIICVISYIAQRIMVNKLIKNKGVNLSTGLMLPSLAFWGVVFLGVIVFGGMTPSEILEESTWMLVLMAVSITALALLLVRNIKGAGCGMGVALSALQILGGGFIFMLAALRFAIKLFGIQMNSSMELQKQMDKERKLQEAAERKKREARELAREEQEAYAAHLGFSSALDAHRYGIGNIDPELL